MSSTNKDIMVSSCANCGKGEEESGKLKNCTACMMVKYCSRECQIAHRSQHKTECRKRAAELHDEKLFKQPPPQYGDCPICFQRLPILNTGSKYMECCGKLICSGCSYAPVYDNQGNVVVEEKCPFCRTPTPHTVEEEIGRTKKRLDAEDPFAIHKFGVIYRDGTDGFPQDHTKALELWHRAGELGYAQAYNNIGVSYFEGRGVGVDKKKATHYYELAAMAGEIQARHNLGLYEIRAGNMDRAVKHLMIAIRDGSSHSLETIQKMYSKGFATKEDYTAALQLYQKYLGEIKSIQRDKAAKLSDQLRYY